MGKNQAVEKAEYIVEAIRQFRIHKKHERIIYGNISEIRPIQKNRL